MPPVTPTTQALLYARLAWAYTKNQQRSHAFDALNRAQEVFSHRRDDDPDPAWTYWLTADEMDVIVGRCEAELGHTVRGQQRLQRALLQCSPGHTRDYAIYSVWLAQTHLRTGEVARAKDLVDDARRMDASIYSAYTNEPCAI